MNTLRAHLGSPTVLTVWLRDETGKITFGEGDGVTMYLYPYGSSVLVETTGIAGTLPAAGKALFTLSDAYGQANLPRGSYRYVVRVEGTQRADGLLEVV